MQCWHAHGKVSWYTVKIGSDDYTHNWCELVATVSTHICSVIFTPCSTQHTIYVNSLQETKHFMVHFTTDMVHSIPPGGFVSG